MLRIEMSALSVSARQPNIYVLIAQDIALIPGDCFLKNQHHESIIVNQTPGKYIQLIRAFIPKDTSR